MNVFFRDGGWSKVNHIITLEKEDKENIKEQIEQINTHIKNLKAHIEKIKKERKEQQRKMRENVGAISIEATNAILDDRPIEELPIKESPIKIKFLILSAEKEVKIDWLNFDAFTSELNDLSKENKEENASKPFQLLVLSSNQNYDKREHDNDFSENHFSKLASTKEERQFQENISLIDFLSVSYISLEARIKSTIYFPCGKATSTIWKKRKYNFIKIFLFNNLDVQLFHFLINGLRRRKSSDSPVIVYDNTIKKNLTRVVSDEIKKFLGNTDDLGDIEDLISDIIRKNDQLDLRFLSFDLTHQVEVEEEINSLNKILQYFNQKLTKYYDRYNAKEKYIFINVDCQKHKKVLEKIKAITHINTIEVPEINSSTSEEELEDWISRYFEEDNDYFIVKSTIGLDKQIGKPPKEIIQNNCVCFLIPEERFFKIS